MKLEMPRNPKRKPLPRAPKTKYTNRDLADAISAVQRNTMKSWTASQEYGIPKGTLINKFWVATLEKAALRLCFLRKKKLTLLLRFQHWEIGAFRWPRSVGESRLLYRWPDIPDELLVKIPDVLCKLKGASVQKRGRKRNFDYEMEENCLDEIESMFLSRICGKGLPMSAY